MASGLLSDVLALTFPQGCTLVKRMMIFPRWRSRLANGFGFTPLYTIGTHQTILAKSQLRSSRSMAEWLSRPFLVDHASSRYQVPNLELDGSANGPISPFSIVYYEYALIHQLSQKYPRLNSNDARSKSHEILGDIDLWISSLPSSLRITDPDTSWDDQHAHIQMQRAALHTFVWLSKIALLKPSLVRPDEYMLEQGGTHARDTSIDACIQVIQSATNMVERSRLTNLKFHFATFALFDTATILCSALMHKVGDGSAVQSRMRQAITQAHKTLSQVAPITIAANNSVKLLERLIAALPVTANPSLDDMFIASGPFDKSSTSDPEQLYPPSFQMPESFADVNQELSTWLEDQNGVQTNGLSGEIRLQDYELNGFDQIWDWGSLGFDIV